MDTIINKVEQSGIVTLDLLSYKPSKTDYFVFDMVPYLFHGYLLQEKLFRAEMGLIDWHQYRNKEVVLYCSNDAIVPYWAYVFIASLLQPHAAFVCFGAWEDHQQLLWIQRIKALDYSIYENKKVVLKASSDVPEAIYVAATAKLMEQVQSLMWGEAGSPLMIYKRKKTI
ncbi:Protein of unknown function [Pedobacter steynii]|uniref:DUF2480 domain-containing protein n=1 Tax=Pedobacter steynii TaxID=430522 RepID=A0A1H0CZB0_9SPHI|nr:DUF2480 family protein [Pedobacter steynii]NQX41706.1 DUF2480 family protein [Pedobacter steynii]SDN63247.1 Protein of unknown function [Pedobacter steynii]